MFETFIVPISGIDFARYIAYYSIISEFKNPDDPYEQLIKPKVIFCASGGCFISYLAMMSSFTSNIENWKISSEMFVYKPVTIFPRLLNFAMFGHMYNRSNIEKYAKERFIPAKTQDVEIISGHYSSSDNKTVITSNRSEKNSIVSQDDLNILGMRAEFLDGDIDKIIKCIQYTTNIPLMLKPLDSDKNIDFGIVSPSPSSYFSTKLKKVIYFSPINIEESSMDNIRSFLFDKNITFELSFIVSKFKTFKQFDALQNVIDFLNKTILISSCCEAETENYCLVIYSTFNIQMDLVNFSSNQLNNIVQKIKNTIKFRLYCNPK